MIRVRQYPLCIAPHEATTYVVEWGAGVTPESLAPEWLEPGAPWAICIRNGLPIEPDQWGLQLAPDDALEFTARPGFVGASTVTSAALGGAQVAGAAAAATATSTFLSAAIPFLQSLSVGLLLNAVTGAFSRKPTERGDDGSGTYGFLELQSNSTGLGQPIPVLYGRHRVAPPRINQYTRNYLDANGDPFSEVFLLFLISEGPIHAVGDKLADGGPFSVDLGNYVQGLQIDNQPAENFTGVEAWVRLGENDQEVIPGFAQPTLQFTVGQTLRESEDNDPPEDVEAVPGSYGPTDPEILKWDNHVSYTMGDEADEFTAVVTFPLGLFEAGTSGLDPNTFECQFRYREVDAGGAPFGNYVVLPKEATVQQAKNGQFSVEFSHRFIEPSTYVAPVLGKYMEMSAGGGGATYVIDDTNVPDAGPDTLAFTFECWVRSTFNHNQNNDDAYLTTWEDTGNSEGFRFFLSAQPNSTAPTLQIGTGSSFVQVQGDFDPVEWVRTTNGTGAWHHVGVTYEADADAAGQGRVRFYLDGKRTDEKFTPSQAILDLGQTIFVGNRAAGGSPYIGGIDQPAYYSRALTPFELFSKHNTASAGLDEEPGLIVGFRVDTEAAAFFVRYSPEVYGPGANSGLTGLALGPDPPAGGDPEISTGDGVVFQPQSGTDQRARYIVECHRVNGEDARAEEQDEASWSLIQLRTYDELEYPSCALLAVRAQQTDQLSSPTPLVTVVADGRKVPVWDGADAEFPVTVDTWTRNPAWITVDALVNKRYGMGRHYTLSSLLMTQWQFFADWCDELVHDAQRSSSVTRVFTSTVSGTYPNGSITVWLPSPPPSNFPRITAGKYVDTNAWMQFEEDDGAAPAWYADFRDQPWPIVAVVRASSGDTAFVLEPGSDPGNNGPYVPTSDVVAKVYERRMEYDAYHDVLGEGAWDVVLGILGTARAVPLKRGAQLGVFFDDVRQPVALVNMAAISEGTFSASWEGVEDRANAAEIEFFDRAQDYARDFVEDEHPTVQAVNSLSAFVWKRTRLLGVTRRSQVARHARRDLNTSHLIRRSAGFGLGMESVTFSPGDLIALSHDLVDWGVSGLVWTDSTYANVLPNPFDLSLWDTNAFALTASESVTSGPKGYGTVWVLSTNGSATAFAQHSVPAGQFANDGEDQAVSFYVKQRTAGTFTLRLKDEDAPVNYDAAFNFTAGVPAVVSADVNMTVSVDSTGLNPGWHRILVEMNTPLGLGGATRTAAILVPSVGVGPFPNQDMDVYGPMLLDETAVHADNPLVPIQIDRPLTLEPATDYQIQVQSATSGARATVEVNAVETPAGDYDAGDVLYVDEPGFGFIPQRDDAYAFGPVSTGDSRLFTMVSTDLEPSKLEVECKAVEYNAAVYDDAFGELESASQEFTDDGQGSAGVVPAGVNKLSVSDEVLEAPDGSQSLAARVSFTHDPDTFHAVGGSHVYVRKGQHDDGGSFQLVATLPASSTQYVITSYPFELNTTYTIAVQPFTRGGAGLYRAVTTWTIWTPQGLANTPPPITGCVASIAGDQVVYCWDATDELTRVRAIEMRRGGWILGLPMAVLPAGAAQYGPSYDFALGAPNSKGVGDAPVQIRSRLGNGQYGPASSLLLTDSVVGSEGNSLETSREDLAWSGTIVNGAVTPVLPGELPEVESSGPGLGFRYEFTGQSFSAAVHVYLQVGLIARQIHPATIAEVSAIVGPLGSRKARQWTIEGPLLASLWDEPNCTVKVEVAHSLGSTPGTDWREYRPGVYRLRSYAVRVTITRPSAAFDFRLSRLYVRATKMGERRVDRVSAASYSLS